MEGGARGRLGSRCSRCCLLVHSTSTAELLIRRSRPRDHRWMGWLADQAFSIYGSEYGVMIPAYARDARIVSLVAERRGERAGFLQVGFVYGSSGRPGLVGDVLAVAVDVPFQGQGVGTALFARAFSLLRPMLERGNLQDVQLTVASTNRGGARLFQRLGFGVMEPSYGLYEGGQVAILMSLWAHYQAHRGELGVEWPPPLLEGTSSRLGERE